MAWDSSTRRSRLPADWVKRRAATKARAGGRCEGISLHGEPRWHVDDCPGVGTDCDHDKRGDDHSLSNLRWLSAECHKAKTQGESHLPHHRQPERHPGLL
jgi:5-methylcytosine-specific restriction protein A